MNVRAERLVIYAVLVMFCIAVLLPFVSILTVALQPPGSTVTGLALPDEVHFDNFRRAWSVGGFGSLMASSAIVAFVVVPTATALSVLAGYAFGTMRFRGSTVLFYLLLIGLVMPFEATVVPLYYDLRELHLTDTYWALILPQIGLSVAFGTFWMRAFFLSSPKSLLEAAQLDGASTWTALWRILLPTARPAVTTLATLFFLWSWNEFLLALVLIQDPDRRTAPAGLGLFVGERTTDIAGLSAGALIVTLPVIVVYLFLQRGFIRGMLEGSIKG
jgi:raffinose/stachyose/melibiose transport system permease protein